MLLVTEFMAGGNLYDAIASGAPDLGWYQRGRRIALDVVKGLVHLHSQKIIHLLSPALASELRLSTGAHAACPIASKHRWLWCCWPGSAQPEAHPPVEPCAGLCIAFEHRSPGCGAVGLDLHGLSVIHLRSSVLRLETLSSTGVLAVVPSPWLCMA